VKKEEEKESQSKEKEKSSSEEESDSDKGDFQLRGPNDVGEDQALKIG
jgi:hypothetical protein